jgi:DNA-binding transcriptional LysR family regulator
LDIRHFITFKTVAKLNSFTKASKELGYAQSSVTAHIQALESHMDTLLFERIGKNIKLTAKGTQLLEYIYELLNAYEKIENLKYEEDEPQGTIRIGVPETLMLYRLDSIFKEYKKNYPKVNIILANTPSSSLVESLHKGDLDIAFVLDHKIEDKDILSYDLIKEQMCFIFPSDFKDISLDKMPKDLSIFFTENGCSYRYIFKNYLKQNGISSDNIMETWSIETIKKCVKNGIGMSFLPRITVYEEEKNKEIKTLPCNSNHKELISQIAYHKKKYLSPALKTFVDLTLKDSKSWLKF